ncbi:MAG: hypothetical protein P8M34_14705 [Saprospiraceae bacterium]|nr:hypothetical protein [Saprospiraceae bacterium]
MPWKEIIVDNFIDTVGKSRRKDKACIILFHSKNIQFRITARHHDGHFKYYLDCDQAEIYEHWIGVPTVNNRTSIKHKAIRKLKSEIEGRNIYALTDLVTAEKELERMK